jgi:HAD superfamily hydrolase (TIGR01456 family)
LRLGVAFQFVVIREVASIGLLVTMKYCFRILSAVMLFQLSTIRTSGLAEWGTTSLTNAKGVALDIDGVLYRSGIVFPRTVEAMKLLESSKIPFVFVTNGGGVTEDQKSAELTKKIGIRVRPEQVVLAHTPFSKISHLKDKRILVVGHEGCLDVARSYGFSKVASVRDIHEENPTIYPHRTPASLPSSAEKGEPVAAILIFHDCLDWGLEMQIIFDIVVGRQQDAGSRDPSVLEVFKQKVPIYTSNADIVYASSHPFPRFTQGAFVEAFKSLYDLSTGEKLIVDTCGKPFKVQYDFATELLEKENQALQQDVITRFYGVGDNPKSDIRGANNAGDNWTSVLVRTGVFTGPDNDTVDPADVVVGDILDAVQFIIADEPQR